MFISVRSTSGNIHKIRAEHKFPEKRNRNREKQDVTRKREQKENAKGKTTTKEIKLTNWYVNALTNSGSLLASSACLENISTAFSILLCWRLSWASVATAASQEGSIRRASLQHRSAAPISCFHWKRVKPLLTRDKTLGGLLYRYVEDEFRKERLRIYLVFSSSIALSNFSTASSNLCWSNNNSPLQSNKSFAQLSNKPSHREELTSNCMVHSSVGTPSMFF